MANRGIITDTNLPVYIKVATLDYTNIKHCHGADFGTKKYNAVISHRENYGKYHPYALVYLYMRNVQKLKLKKIAETLPEFSAEAEYLQAELTSKYNAAWVKDMMLRFNSANAPIQPAKPKQKGKAEAAANSDSLIERLRALCSL